MVSPVHCCFGLACILLATLLGAAPSASARYLAGGDRHASAASAPGEARAAGPGEVLSLAPTEVLGRAAGGQEGPDRPAPGRGVWPLRPQPEVVARFDPPASRWGAGHRGADLLGHVGQEVRAALPGRISFVGRIAGRGVVVVDHGTIRTTYEPVLGTVSRRQRVAAGQVIGRLGGAGTHCPPRACLHWGLRRGQTYLDPLTLVDAPGPVRLLPW
jgi:murein DD-endopeptidase MepM/ murein hydrolase activator NlpD